MSRRISVPDNCKNIFKMAFPQESERALVGNFDPTEIYQKSRPKILEFQRHLEDTEGSDHCPIYDLISIY